MKDGSIIFGSASVWGNDRLPLFLCAVIHWSSFHGCINGNSLRNEEKRNLQKNDEVLGAFISN